MTGVVPGSGAGGRACGISGVVSDGGRMTPSVRFSRSLRLSPGRVSDCVDRGSCSPPCGWFGRSCPGPVWAIVPELAPWSVAPRLTRQVANSRARIGIS
jgi:hypothetical protein